MRRIGLVIGFLVVLTVGLIALAVGRNTLPTCDGSFQGTLDSGTDAGFDTREDAAAHALDITYEVNVGDLVLEESGGSLFRVIELNGAVVEAPPTVAIERTEAGFVPTGVLC